MKLSLAHRPHSPATSNSPSPTTSSNPAISFSSLPPEIRHQIWRSTFTPRTLSLYFHEQKVPASHPILFHVENYTCRLGLQISYSLPPNASLHPPLVYNGTDTMCAESRIKPPPGHVALHICHESREIALQHYARFCPGSLRAHIEPAFTKVFRESGYLDPQIWVNPALDLVFLSSMTRDAEGYFAPVDLQFFRYRCPHEITKFERIAVMFHNGELGLMDSLHRYTGLKELLVFHTRRDVALYRLVAGDGEGIPGVEERADTIVEYLTERKEGWEEAHRRSIGYEPWDADIPRVRVEETIEWFRDEEGKMGLRIQPGLKGDGLRFHDQSWS